MSTSTNSLILPVALQPLSRGSRQPDRQRWSVEEFMRQRAINLGMSLELSTRDVYNSATRSYIHFCCLHDFPIDPSPDTLAHFVTWICIADPVVSPATASGYLSGICSVLEPIYPNIRSARNSPLVSKTLAGLRKRLAIPVKQKKALTVGDIEYVYGLYCMSVSLDDFLFVAIFAAGFHALHRLGELCWADEPIRRNYRRVIRRSSVSYGLDFFSYLLPAHKADMSFAGNTIYIQRRWPSIDPVPVLLRYLKARDEKFPLFCELWLTSEGVPPTKSWFQKRLHRLFPSDISGHSLRSGGATALALDHVPDSLIQKIGRWSSDAWQGYIRAHPVLLAGLVTDFRRAQENAPA